MRIASVLFALMLSGLFGGVQATEVDIESLPGYIDLEDIVIPEAAESVADISLGPELLRMAFGMQDKTDEDGEQKVFAIRVKSFESEALDMETLEPIIARIEAKLKAENWEQIVRVKEGNERTTVSVKYDEKYVLGLFVMAIEPGDEVAFVNVVGRFNLSDLKDFDIDLDDAAIDSLREKFGEQDDED